MRVHPRFPQDAHKNCDFITKRATLKPGEKVLNTQVDVEELGMHGLLCVTESTVRMMMGKLKITAVDDDVVAERDRLASENAELQDHIKRLKAALTTVQELTTA